MIIVLIAILGILLTILVGGMLFSLGKEDSSLESPYSSYLF